jgi:diguanylate cyclase (GGDEF)-like protein/putative nucleotidyltransferase with HDIG domain
LTAQSELLEKLYLDVQQLSLRDPLTNIYNRRGFFEAAHPHVSEAIDSQSELSALMVDIDYFKMVNDVYGHYVGDCVLRALAEEVQKSLRATDLLGRFGGEEFIILLPNTPANVACIVANRVRERIENLVVYVEGFQVSVTVSAGVSHLDNGNGTLDTLLTRADEAMYVAKWSGRNQVVLWNPLLAHQARKEVNPANPGEPARRDLVNRSGVDAARIYDETIEGWAHALELRDKETEGHAQRVTSLAIELSRRMGIPEKDLVDVRRGALLHDIGKIAIPDGILFKPGRLSEQEWEVMRKHPVYAFELLSPITFLQKAIDIPYCHHEHWDGSGYPRGLKGTEIPLAARIFTVIDVWDALSTDRCYRPAWQPEKVSEYIQAEIGKLFDPEIVPMFFEMLEGYQSRNQ